MKIDIQSLESGINRLELTFKSDDLKTDIVECPVKGTLQLTIDKAETSLLFIGELKAVASMACSRCLKPVRIKFEMDFSFMAKEVLTGEDEDDDLDIMAYNPGDKEIDIASAVSEEILVNLPMKPVCKESCKGFCPICGINKNEKKCGCKTTTYSPLQEALLKLKRSE
ncbi:MAG: hypothetical protein A2293_10590 [Elusimicrobia bacterium RIFOXYB2_FULL_49_7]|nr:MAG: hypothetical protein A2293_10590 [Elusimicrobia bacterium RIFOXYB2_FULL_49_7]